MNRNILCFCIAGMFCAGMPLCAQEKSTATAKTESKHGRIERVKENDLEIVRFFDKDGRKNQEIQLGISETTVRLKKDKAYSPATFELNISTTLAMLLESVRKHSGRDMEVKRRTSKSAETSSNGKHLTIEEFRADFLNYADATESESLGEAIESERITTVYDSEGNEILRLGPGEERGGTVSNTGEFFTVAVGDIGGKIINRKKEVLATIPFNASRLYFSENDKFVIFVERISTEICAVSVYDTRKNTLELRKTSVDAMTFQGIKWVKISEAEKTITIQHMWDPAKQEKKVDTVRF